MLRTKDIKDASDWMQMIGRCHSLNDRDIYHSTPAPAGVIGIKSALIRKRLLRFGERLPVISPNLILTRVPQPIQTSMKKIYT